MEDIKRYNYETGYSGSDFGDMYVEMVQQPEGDYVRYEDHAAEIARLKAIADEWADKCRFLAVRNSRSSNLEKSAREVAAWFTSGNSVPVDGRHMMTISCNDVMADVHALNQALAAMEVN